VAKRRKKKARPAPRKRPARAPKLRRDGRGRLRDYRKEYKRRVKLEKQRELEAQVARDARRVFGRKPKRGFEDDDAGQYELRLAELAEREGRFDWLDEKTFIAEMRARGATEREAYTLWFSP